MIRYRLQCSKKHEFEAWFASSEGFEKQSKRGLVACPDCGSTKVSKALMAPSVVTSKRKEARRRPSKRSPEASAPAPAPAVAEPQAMLDGPQREMLRELKKLRDKVLEDAEYVGPRFAEEARRIHEDEAPARGIYGEASVEDVKQLSEDGIEVFPVPVLPDDQN
jgi:hypothetical protein